MRPRLSSSVLALLVTCSSAHGQARAQAPVPSRVELAWQHDGSCPAPTDGEQQLAALLGAAPGADEPRHLQAQVARTDRGSYRLRLEAQHAGVDSTRTLELASCEEAQETAILLLAMTLEPREPRALPEPSAPPPEPPAPAEERVGPPVRMGVSAQLGADFTLLPGTAPLGALGVVAQRAVLRLSLQGRYLTRATTERLPASSEARLSLLELAPALCVVWPLTPLGLGLCADAALGRVRARAEGVDMPRTQQAFWASAGASALLEYRPVPAISLELRLSVAASLQRSRFALVGQAPFHELPSTAVRALLGITLWLPTTEPRRAGH